MNQTSNREEDLVHQSCRIKQARCIHWGWARHSHCSTSAAINPTQWYWNYSSHCSSQDLDLCSALHYFGQPSQPLLFLLLWPPHLALSSIQVQEQINAKKWVSKTVLHIRGELLHTYSWGELWGPGGQGKRKLCWYRDTSGENEEGVSIMAHGLYRWLVSSREKFAAHN